MTAISDLYAGVYAQGVYAGVKAVVLDDRLWRYKKRKRREWHVPEADLKLLRRAGHGSGLLVLRGRYSSIHGQPDDATLLGLAQEIWDGGLLEECAKSQQWPATLRAELGARQLEIVVVSPDSVTVPWEQYSREAAVADVLDEAESIAEEASEEMKEAARLALAAEVEQRLLRAGVTFTTHPKHRPGQWYHRHPVTGDLLSLKGQLIPEEDVHEHGFDDFDDGVVMSYATLLRLLKKIDPRFESDGP